MSSLKTRPFPGQNENMKADVELASSEGAAAIKMTGDPRLCLRLLAEAIIQLGPNIRDGMGDDFGNWKKETWILLFEACFGDADEVLRKAEAEIEALEKEIKGEAAKRGIVIDADAIV